MFLLGRGSIGVLIVLFVGNLLVIDQLDGPLYCCLLTSLVCGLQCFVPSMTIPIIDVFICGKMRMVAEAGCHFKVRK